MNKKFDRELLADVAERLINHLKNRTDVQNIDLMNLAGFCRNCISKWYLSEADKCGEELDYEQAREIVYGMPYPDWKDKHQKPASPEQLAKLEENAKNDWKCD